jgi:hypothetical protein
MEATPAVVKTAGRGASVLNAELNRPDGAPPVMVTPELEAEYRKLMNQLGLNEVPRLSQDLRSTLQDRSQPPQRCSRRNPTTVH